MRNAYFHLSWYPTQKLPNKAPLNKHQENALCLASLESPYGVLRKANGWNPSTTFRRAARRLRARRLTASGHKPVAAGLKD